MREKISKKEKKDAEIKIDKENGESAEKEGKKVEKRNYKDCYKKLHKKKMKLFPSGLFISFITYKDFFSSNKK